MLVLVLTISIMHFVANVKLRWLASCLFYLFCFILTLSCISSLYNRVFAEIHQANMQTAKQYCHLLVLLFFIFIFTFLPPCVRTHLPKTEG